MFRFASANTYDSDDDQSLPDTNHTSLNNSLRVNNHHNHVNNGTSNHHSADNTKYNDGASTSTSTIQNNHTDNNRRHYPNQESEHDFEDYVSSTNNSNSLLSSTESSSNDGYADGYFNSKKRKLKDENESANGTSSFPACSTSTVGSTATFERRQRRNTTMRKSVLKMRCKKH